MSTFGLVDIIIFYHIGAVAANAVCRSLNTVSEEKRRTGQGRVQLLGVVVEQAIA